METFYFYFFIFYFLMFTGRVDFEEHKHFDEVVFHFRAHPMPGDKILIKCLAISLFINFLLFFSSCLCFTFFNISSLFQAIYYFPFSKLFILLNLMEAYMLNNRAYIFMDSCFPVVSCPHAHR